MKIQQLEKDVPFDQFNRQFQVAEILNKVRIGGEPLSILDVGGYKGRTQDFLDTDKVTVVDIFKVKEVNYVQANALDLPFKDGTFDYVVSFDVLEHIPDKDRKKFISECVRVSRHGVAICAPHKSPLNEMSEKKLNSLYRRLHRKPHRWLREHIKYGLPDFAVVEEMMHDLDLHTCQFYSNKTQLWFAMQQAIFSNSKFPLAAEDLIRLNEFYNKNLRHDSASNDLSYRQILCGFRSQQSVHKLREKIAARDFPIDAALELAVHEKIFEYFVSLISKTSQLANDYESLFNERESKYSNYERLKELEKLVEEYEKLPSVQFTRKLKDIFHGNKHTS